jgi:ATP-dependent Lhr-like helicase
VQRDFLQNIGVIPEVGVVNVRLKNRSLGSVEEMFIRQIKPGDVFVIAGRPVRLERVDQMEAFVTRADGAVPTIPRWNANKMPLSNNVAREIVSFRGELRGRMQNGNADNQYEQSDELASWIAGRLDCGKANAEIIRKLYAAQQRLSEIPTADFLLIEEFIESEVPEVVASKATRKNHARPRHYFFHSLIGRAANDALSRVITLRLSKLRGGNALATPHDYGFVLTVSEHQFFTAEDFPELLSPDEFFDQFHLALSNSEMLKYHFRNCAQTGLMVYRNYFSQRKPLRKLQWSAEVIFNVLQRYEPDHVLLREAQRETMHTFLDAEGAANYLERLARENIPVRLKKVHRVPPLSFAMYATKIREALLVEDPTETMERLFHLWWKEIEVTDEEPARR